MPPKKANPKAPSAKSKAKVVNKNAAAIANLRMIQEARRKQQEEDRKRQERERRRREQEELERKQREEEERKLKEKKEEEKLRKAKLRQTKGKRMEDKKMAAAREALLAGGQYITSQAIETEEKPTMSLAQKKREKRRQRELAEQKKREEEERREKEEAEKKKKEEEAADEVDEDDWEKELDDYEAGEGEGEAAAEESEDSELPMDDESILERHEKRMRQTIRSTIRRIQAAQKESGTAIASVSISSAAHASVLPPTPEEDEEDQEEADAKLPLRSPVVCILGHVDVGKTKILDKLRQTNVQTGEAGGITQQIGATFFPVANIRPTLMQAKDTVPPETYDRLPGLLIIDTPGHESFTNLRSRGSSMCNLAILVVDIMHSLEPQTIESLNMILSREVPFVIALNKIDVLTEWVPCTVRTEDGQVDRSFQTVINSQPPHVKEFFKDRLTTVIHDLALKGVNAALYTDKDKDWSEYVRIIPTSAKTGEGLPDLLANLLSIAQTELEDEIRIKPELEATVMEIKTITGLGTTADIILANGTLSEGDTIVVCGSEGAIVSQIRSLLTPHPMKEIRVKAEYLSHKSIMASIGVKVCAAGLENALAGSQLHVAYAPEEIEPLENKVEEELESVLGSFECEESGTYVVASTVGSLEALVTYLKSVQPPVPIANLSVGPVHKRDVMKAAVMLEKNRQMAVILAFDVPIDEDAQEEADKQGVQIFRADIIYHLTQRFEGYLDQLKQEEGEKRKKDCIYPARLRVLQCFHESDPVIIGVRVEVGRLRVGAPIVGFNLDKALVEKAKTKAQQAGQSATQALATARAQAEKEAKIFEIGVVESIEKDRVAMRVAESGAEVAIKIGRGKLAVPIFGKQQFDLNTTIITKFNRESIDYLKEYEKTYLDSDQQLKSFIKNTRALLGIAAPTKAPAAAPE